MSLHSHVADNEEWFLPVCEFGQFTEGLLSVTQENSVEQHTAGAGLMITKEGTVATPQR
jgi:hypothetical protein